MTFWNYFTEKGSKNFLSTCIHSKTRNLKMINRRQLPAHLAYLQKQQHSEWALF